jgi:hypothetical protein
MLWQGKLSNLDNDNNFGSIVRKTTMLFCAYPVVKIKRQSMFQLLNFKQIGLQHKQCYFFKLLCRYGKMYAYELQVLNNNF